MGSTSLASAHNRLSNRRRFDFYLYVLGLRFQFPGRLSVGFTIVSNRIKKKKNGRLNYPRVDEIFRKGTIRFHR